MDVLLCSLVSWHPFSTGWNSAYLLGLNSGLTSSVKLLLTIPALTDLSSLQSLPKPRMCPAQLFAALLSFRTSVHVSGLKLPKEQNTAAHIHDLNHSQNLGHIVGIQKNTRSFGWLPDLELSKLNKVRPEEFYAPYVYALNIPYKNLSNYQYANLTVKFWISDSIFSSLRLQGPAQCPDTAGIQFLFLLIVWTDVTKCIHYIPVPSLFLVQCEVLSRSSISTYRYLSSLVWLDRSRTFSFAESFYPSLCKCPCWGLRQRRRGARSWRLPPGEDGNAECYPREWQIFLTLFLFLFVTATAN